MNKLLISLCALILSFSAFADETVSYSKADILERVIRLSETHYPEIKTEKIKIKEFKREKTDGFFNTFPGFWRGLVRSYAVRVNFRLFEQIGWPSEEALDAVLLHELSHIDEYRQGSYFRYFGFSVKYGLCGDANKREVERATDLKVLERGLAEGLKAYRLWQQEVLTPEQIEKKFDRYLSPEEIEIWQGVNGEI